jgi:predicted HAD superfamily Cof-like phosphohydrolase
MTLQDNECCGGCACDEAGFTIEGDWVQDNLEMHQKFGVHEAVEKLDGAKLLKFLEFRLNFLQEELDEAKKAFGVLETLRTMPDDSHEFRTMQVQVGDVPTRSQATVAAADDIVDAMIDLCVVAIGTLNALQVDAYEAWARVHDANMTKEVGIKASRPNPLGLPDLVKPAGWVPPVHSDNVGIIPRIVESSQE